ncbi:MAG: YdcF family protein [Patescibacteria group bacterium]|jgi:hypothetical protein|nr:YdcF family protein [Patescibacteria group bacterium]
MLDFIPIRAVAVLAGGIIKDKNGKWHTTNFGEPGDHAGVTGDRLRVEAATYLYFDDPELLIIASAGKGHLQNVADAPMLAEIIAEELIENGVASDHIFKEVTSNSTYEQLLEIQRLSAQKNIKELGIVSNEYHLPRIKAMIDNFNQLADLRNDSVKLISAEKVLIDHDPDKWSNLISQAYNSSEMVERLAKEEQGIADIEVGKYEFRDLNDSNKVI